MGPTGRESKRSSCCTNLGIELIDVTTNAIRVNNEQVKVILEYIPDVSTQRTSMFSNINGRSLSAKFGCSLAGTTMLIVFQVVTKVRGKKYKLDPRRRKRIIHKIMP